jgi:hypothetical protein
MEVNKSSEHGEVSHDKENKSENKSSEKSSSGKESEKWLQIYDETKEKAEKEEDPTLKQHFEQVAESIKQTLDAMGVQVEGESGDSSSSGKGGSESSGEGEGAPKSSGEGEGAPESSGEGEGASESSGGEAAPESSGKAPPESSEGGAAPKSSGSEIKTPGLSPQSNKMGDQAVSDMMQGVSSMVQGATGSGSPGGTETTGGASATSGMGSLGGSAGAAPAAGQQMGVAKGTGYYPADDPVEGGFVDMQGSQLNTLQDFVEGKAPYVSIALDQNLYDSGALSYGDTFRIPELEQKYGMPIVFKAVDTGPSFEGQGFGRVDICTRSEQDSLDGTINGSLSLMKAAG